MNNSDQNNQKIMLSSEEGIDIKKYIFLILSHWWWFGISIFIALTIAYLINRYTQELYSVSCSVIVGEEETGTGSIESILDELSRVRNKKRKAVVENEISILKSYKMSRLALEELDFNISYTAVGRRNIAETQLYKNSPFVVIPDTTSKSELIGTYFVTILSNSEYRLSNEDHVDKVLKFGESFKKDEIGFKIKLRDPEAFVFEDLVVQKFYFTAYSSNAMALQFSNELKVDVNDEKGSILTLTITGYVPYKIADYLNKLCEVYLRSNLLEKNQASINTIQFIDEQLRNVVDSLEITGLRLQKFRSENKVINISREGTFLFEKMQELQSQMAILEVNTRYYEYLLDYIDTRDDFSDIVAPSVVGIEDPLLSKLVNKLNELNLQRRNLNLSVRDDSPQLNVINNEIENTRSALHENLQSLIAANLIAKEELQERILKIESGVQKLPSTERQLINIQREFTINDQIYTFLLEKRAEAGITRASNTSDHKILDVARAENANIIKPKVSSNYFMAFLFGGLIPLMLLIIVEYFNNKILDKKDIEDSTDVPIAGSIGHNDLHYELPVVENPKSSLAESFRNLRANLQFLGKNKKVIVISSTISGEGKTFCAVNLASIMAMAGNKTLLLSLDLRRPKVHRVFNLNNDFGLSTFLSGRSKAKDIIQETNVKNLFIATSGPVPPNPAELIGSDELMDFIKVQQQNFDYILIDTPPVAIVTDAILLRDITDIYLFVIRHGYSTKSVLNLVDDLYIKKKIKNLSLLVNDVQLRGYYGYGYRYGYDYSYGYGYYSKGYYEDEPEPTLIQKIKSSLFKK